MLLARSFAVSLMGCAALLVACQSAPPPVERQQWSRLDSRHFEMWSAAPPPESRGLLEDLERLRSVLPLVAGIDPGAARMRIVAFDDPESLGEFRRGLAVPSFALATLDGPVLVFDASSTQARFDLRHAFVHAILRVGGDPGMAPWYEEGLAEYLAQVEIGDDAIRLGSLPARLAPWLRLGNPLPLRRVLGAGASRITWSEGELARFGAQSWALVHLLLANPHLAEADRRDTLVASVQRLLGGEDAESAATGAFGDAGLAKLQTEFVAYLRRETFATITLKSITPPSPAAQLRAASTGEALQVLAALAADLGTAEALIGRLRGAIQADPARTGSAFEKALRDPTTDTAEIAAALDEMEARGPESADRWTRIGDYWRALAARDETLAGGRTAAAYHRALALDENHAAAARGLATTFGTSWEDHAAAAALLQRASAGRSGVPAVELALAERLTGAGQAGRAGRILERLARTPHLGAMVDPGAIEAALQRTGVSLSALEGRLWESQLMLRTPRDDAILDQMAPWIEVTGSAGLGESPRHDVVVALDLSELTQLPSGLDVNGNGRVGRQVDPALASPIGLRIMTTDRGDTILAAQRWVAAELVEQLDALSTRVAVLGYGTKAFLIAPFGTPGVAAAALDSFSVGGRVPFQSSLHSALLGSLDVLQEENAVGEPRRTTVLLVAGLEPAYPNIRRARRRGLEAAEILGQVGVRVHTFAVGKDAPKKLGPLLKAVSEVSGGEYTPVLDVTAVSLPDTGLRLSGLSAVEIRNLTSGQPARAQRVFADGSFDAMVPLAPGENVIEVVARPVGRPPLRETRRVQYTVPDEPTAQHRRRAAVLLWELRNRSIEVAARLDIADAQAARLDVASGPSIPEAPPLQRTELTIDVAEEPNAEPVDDPEPAVVEGGAPAGEDAASTEPPPAVDD